MTMSTAPPMTMTDHPRQSTPIAPRERSGEAAETIARLERDIRELRDELAHAQRLTMLGTMAAGAAHEINNLLTPVLAYAQLARQNRDQPEFTERAIEKAAGGVERASRIAETMLALASPRQASPQTPARAACIQSVCDHAVECLPRPIERDGIDLTIDIPDDLHAAIDQFHLQQVVLNLLLNSIDVLRSVRGASIVIEAEAPMYESVCITVSDNGPGIPADIRRTLFEPFVTCPATTDEAGQDTSDQRKRGMGLGLAICRRLIEAAGGEIDVESEPGQGTCFTITLRKAESPTPAEHQTA